MLSRYDYDRLDGELLTIWEDNRMCTGCCLRTFLLTVVGPFTLCILPCYICCKDASVEGPIRLTVAKLNKCARAHGPFCLGRGGGRPFS